MTKKNKQKALTVIEVLVVIFIIIIISSVGLGVFVGFRSAIDLNGSARELISDLRLAQQLAVSEQIKHGVQFFSADDKYQIIRYDQTPEVLKEKELPNNISFKAIEGLGLDRVRFNPYGAAEENGSVVLQNNNNSEKTILIKPSGFVKLN